MDLPEQLPTRNIVHGSGAKGAAMYVNEDTLGLGVIVITSRKAGNQPFASVYLHRWMPNQEFNSYSALRVAASVVTPAMVALEQAQYPQVGAVGGDHAANKCLRHRDRKSVMRATVAACWVPMLVDSCGLCQECSVHATGNGQGILDMIEERRAYVASLPPIRERLGLDQPPINDNDSPF